MIDVFVTAAIDFDCILQRIRGGKSRGQSSGSQGGHVAVGATVSRRQSSGPKGGQSVAVAMPMGEDAIDAAIAKQKHLPLGHQANGKQVKFAKKTPSDTKLEQKPSMPKQKAKKKTETQPKASTPKAVKQSLIDAYELKKRRSRAYHGE